MSAEAPGFTASWRVGRYTVTMTAPRFEPGMVRCAAIEWEPYMPDRLSRKERAAYFAGRNAALAKLAGEAGIRIAVVDL